MRRTLIIALLASLIAPISSAQMRGGVRVGAGGMGSRHFRSGGFAYPFFYSDYGPASGPPPSAPPVLIEKKVIQPDRPTEPLLIEWQGDHFVRYGGAAASASPDYAEVASATSAGMGSKPITELPPAVLVYRDGHREEVSDYVITRGVLYARNNHSEPGSGMRNIQLSALNLSATFKANQDSGVKFVLPPSAGDVVTRP